MKIVGIGGGHGLSRGLAAMRHLGEQPTAVVTVADDGGSSGRLREDHDVVALGDMRMALFTLAEDAELAAVFQHRFHAGELEGHALGNLFLLALLEVTGGDLVRALDRAATLLRCRGRVLPATTETVQLRARVAGEEVGGQVRVATSEGAVERVWLIPESPAACEESVAAIENADAIVLGPGSLFTSILATLAVPGIARAVAASSGRVIYVANLLTQPGETSDLTAADHVEALLRHVPDLHLDAVVLHDGPDPHGHGRPLGSELTHPAVTRVVHADLAARTHDGAIAVSHDPQRLAVALELALGPSGAA